MSISLLLHSSQLRSISRPNFPPPVALPSPPCYRLFPHDNPFMSHNIFLSPGSWVSRFLARPPRQRARPADLGRLPCPLTYLTLPSQNISVTVTLPQAPDGDGCISVNTTFGQSPVTGSRACKEIHWVRDTSTSSYTLPYKGRDRTGPGTTQAPRLKTEAPTLL